MSVYDNLIDAINDLKNRGFTTDFNIAFDTIKCSSTGISLTPTEFEIVEHYRFEADTDPSESSVLYAIEAKNHSLKGILINAYGVYGDVMSDDIIKKLSVHQ